MYTIGEISKIVNISTDTLRYYDEIGLLAPSRTDPSSKYRYYTDEQVKYILLIMELKQYGFTLQEIKDLSKLKDQVVLKNAFNKRLAELKAEVTNMNCLIDILTKRIDEFTREDNNRMNNKKILIVDNITLVRFLLRNMLEKHNYEIIGEAATGLEAVEKYMELKPDLVIMDIVMPIMDGIYATSKILERDADAKIIMCSNMSQASIVIEAIKSGACGFLSKPFQELDLYDEVETALNNPRHFDPEYLQKIYQQLHACNYGNLDNHKLLLQPQMKQLIHILYRKAADIDFDEFVLQSTDIDNPSPPDHYLSLRSANIGSHKLNGLSEYFLALADNFNKHNSPTNKDHYRLRFCSIEQSLNLDTYPMLQDSGRIGIIQITGQKLPLAIIPYQYFPSWTEDTVFTWIFQELSSLLPGESALHQITGSEFKETYNNVYPQVNVVMELEASDAAYLIAVNIPHEIAGTDDFYNHILQWKLTKL